MSGFAALSYIDRLQNSGVNRFTSQEKVMLRPDSADEPESTGHDALAGFPDRAPVGVGRGEKTK
jgi:hypothetical protein